MFLGSIIVEGKEAGLCKGRRAGMLSHWKLQLILQSDLDMECSLRAILSLSERAQPV